RSSWVGWWETESHQHEAAVRVPASSPWQTKSRSVARSFDWPFWLPCLDPVLQNPLIPTLGLQLHPHSKIDRFLNTLFVEQATPESSRVGFGQHKEVVDVRRTTL